VLTNAVSIGGEQFALSRSDTTPYTDAVSAVKNAAPGLTPASLAITLVRWKPPDGHAAAMRHA
jgi:hypothetical protein